MVFATLFPLLLSLYGLACLAAQMVSRAPGDSAENNRIEQYREYGTGQDQIPAFLRQEPEGHTEAS